MRVPHSYTDVEGGRWMSWPAGLKVTEENLAKRDRKHVMIHGLRVHSLAFQQPICKYPRQFKRWDCINGMNHNV